MRCAPLCCFDEKEQARKDEIESWMYTMIELAAGPLPWGKDRDRGVVEKHKMDLRTDPAALARLMEHVPSRFTEIRQYSEALSVGRLLLPLTLFAVHIAAVLQVHLRQAMRHAGISEIDSYDWEDEGPTITARVE